MYQSLVEQKNWSILGKKKFNKECKTEEVSYALTAIEVR